MNSCGRTHVAPGWTGLDWAGLGWTGLGRAGQVREERASAVAVAETVATYLSLWLYE